MFTAEARSLISLRQQKLLSQQVRLAKPQAGWPIIPPAIFPVRERAVYFLAIREVYPLPPSPRSIGIFG
jgi:hypothetical protein